MESQKISDIDIIQGGIKKQNQHENYSHKIDKRGENPTIIKSPEKIDWQ